MLKKRIVVDICVNEKEIVKVVSRDKSHEDEILYRCR